MQFAQIQRSENTKPSTRKIKEMGSRPEPLPTAPTAPAVAAAPLPNDNTEPWADLQRCINEGKNYEDLCKTHFELCAKHEMFIRNRITARSNAACAKVFVDASKNPDTMPLLWFGGIGWLFAAVMVIAWSVIVVESKEICKKMLGV